MDSQSKTIAELKKQINQIKKCYSTILYLFENGDVESSVIIGTRAMAKLKIMFDRIKEINEYNKAYINMVLASRIPTFENDLGKIKDLARDGNVDFSAEEKTASKEIIDRMEVYITVANKELATIFLIEGVFHRLWKSVWSKRMVILKIVGPVIIIVSGILIWRNIDIKKHSLVAEYFYDANFSDLYKKRNDRVIDFSWGYSGPFWGFNVDHFSIRWTGYLVVPAEGEYSFKTESDDGVRLIIDGNNVIENWSLHSIQQDTAALSLAAGVHEIKLEYFEYNANAEIRLLWKDATEKDYRVIPSDNFISEKKYL